jgi:hypothetical protein
MSSRAEKVWPSLEQRMVIFRALVEAQDGGASVHRSRREVAEQFGVSGPVLLLIELQGLDRNWPPLSPDGLPGRPAGVGPVAGDGA